MRGARRGDHHLRPSMTDNSSRKRSAVEAFDGRAQLEISDVDPRLIGLSPQYWSYTPLLIADLVALPLINGVDCFVGCGVEQHDTDAAQKDRNSRVDAGGDTDQRRHGQQPTEPMGSGDGSRHILPLSRVLLRGIATAVDQRPNGCTLIVLDDGTGSIDCRYWDDTCNSAFNLPSLLPYETSNKRRFVVGDSLEVMGKIKALTAGTTIDKGKLSDCSAVPLEVRLGCVREIHASSVCLIEGQTRVKNKWDSEVVHWLKCIQFSRKAGRRCNSIDTKDNHGIRNGKEVLPFLGEAISSSILSDGAINFSNLSDNTPRNNCFLQRKCCQTPYRFRKALFYCHCEATLEVLDPSFRYRDALINRLLDMEDRLRRSSESFHPSATEDCMDLLGASDPSPPPLLFTFESVYKDEELASVASEAVASTTAPEANALRLVRKTFAAMANDGILSLYDAEGDLYLLVSRTRVIEPFLRHSNGLGEGGFGAGPAISQPFFIRRIPRKRITEIKNWNRRNSIENGATR